MENLMVQRFQNTFENIKFLFQYNNFPTNKMGTKPTVETHLNESEIRKSMIIVTYGFRPHYWLENLKMIELGRVH